MATPAPAPPPPARAGVTGRSSRANDTAAQLRSGRNPIPGVASKPPFVGNTVAARPSATVGWPRQDWTSGLSRTPGGPFGQQGLPSRGPGVSSAGAFSAHPSMSTEYAAGWPSNYSIPHAKMTAASMTMAGQMKGKQKYMLVFTYRMSKERAGKRRIPESRRYTIANIVELNYILASLERLPATPDEVLSAGDAWEHWTVEGVVATEEGEDDDLLPPNNLHPERLFNTTVRGHTQTFSGWTGGVPAGTQVWLVLKKRPIDPQSPFVLSPDGGGVRTVAAQQRDDVTTRPFQLSFWADPQLDEPPDSELQYEDEFGRLHRGLAIFVGTAESSVQPSSLRYRPGEVESSISALLCQPMLWLFLDPS